MFIKPSFFALVFSGLSIGIALILFALSYEKISSETIIRIILLFSIAVGIHGLLHFVYELHYGFNPLTKIA